MIEEQKLIDWLEDGLEQSERSAVEAQIADDPKSLELVSTQLAMNRALHLHWTGRSTSGDLRKTIMEAVKKAAAEGAKPPEADTPADAPKTDSGATGGTRTDSHTLPSIFVWGGVAAALVLLGLFVMLPKQKPDPVVSTANGPDSTIATAAPPFGGVPSATSETPPTEAESADMATLKVGVDSRSVNLGEEINVDKDAELTFPPRSSLTLSSGARVVLGPAAGASPSPNARRTVQLLEGTITAVVQKGQVLFIHTPHAEMTVKSLSAALTVRAQDTLVEVDKGEIEVRLLAGDQALKLLAGDFIRITPNHPLISHSLQDAGDAVAERDPWKWPFDAESPWNQPIGTGALFAGVALPDGVSEPQQMVQLRAVLVHDSKEGLTPTKISVSAESGAVIEHTLPLPDWSLMEPMLDPGRKDLPFIMFRRDAGMVAELFLIEKPDKGVMLVRGLKQYSLTGTGFAPYTPGLAAHGGACLGGYVWTDDPVAHALALGVNSRYLSRDAQSQLGYVWPAISAGSHEASFGVGGNLRVGTLLALPPDEPINHLKGLALLVAEALQNYGGYVSDVIVSDDPVLYRLRGSGWGKMPKELEKELSPIFKKLQVITNHDAENLGGGGKPRRPKAPVLERVEK